MSTTKISNILIGLIMLSSFGCMHTYVNDRGKDSPDMKYKIFIVCHGKSSHAYTDYTVKKAFIGIYKKNRSDDSLLFSMWAVLKATDLSWEYNWTDPKSIRINFFEGKVKSESETPRGFIVIRKDELTNKFRETDHSANINFEGKVYFF